MNKWIAAVMYIVGASSMSYGTALLSSPGDGYVLLGVLLAIPSVLYYAFNFIDSEY